MTAGFSTGGAVAIAGFSTRSAWRAAGWTMVTGSGLAGGAGLGRGWIAGAGVIAAGAGPVPSSAGLMRNAGSGSAAADPAAINSRIDRETNPNCPWRKIGMPDQ